MSDTERKPGAPRGNRNSTRHGLRMVVGKLPKHCGYIASEVSKLRRILERAVAEKHGAISPAHALAIQSVARWEQASLLSQRYLRLKGDTLSPELYRTFNGDIARASSARDRYIRALGIECSGKSGMPDWAAMRAAKVDQQEVGTEQ